MSSTRDRRDARKKTFVVVENAGYEGEYIVPRDFDSFIKAYDYMDKHYDEVEVDENHIAVAVKKPSGELSFEF